MLQKDAYTQKITDAINSAAENFEMLKPADIRWMAKLEHTQNYDKQEVLSSNSEACREFMTLKTGGSGNVDDATHQE